MALRKFPGFIDVHVHLRDPGATHKENFVTGSRAAVAGGFTFIIDMPNNTPPTFGISFLNKKISSAKKIGLCDIGFHYGTNGFNTKTFKKAFTSPHIYGLKVYLNHTTGELLIEDLNLLEKIFVAWNCEKPILVHAEGIQLAGAIALADFYKRRIHVCHISQGSEIELVRKAKNKKIKITAGVTPHHLFLIDKDIKKLGSFGLMKPPLGTKKNRDALWEGLWDKTIDIIETDHAPHTKKEKNKDKPPFGVPGLETAVGLLFKGVHDKKIKIPDVIRLLYENPKKIFNIPDQKNTYVELDPLEPYQIGENGYQTKCAWSPYDGWEAYGKVKQVVLRGKSLINDI